MSNNNYASKINNIMDKAKEDVRTQIDRVYQQGYADAKSEKGQNIIDLAHKEIDRAYQRGLEDAWEAVKKIKRMDIAEKDAIFAEIGKSTYSVVMSMSASEVITKIKEYEDKQKQNIEIKVGDEVTTRFGSKGIVITDVPSEKGDISVWFRTCTHVQLYPVKDLSKTGRTFPQIAEVLEKMRGE